MADISVASTKGWRSGRGWTGEIARVARAYPAGAVAFVFLVFVTLLAAFGPFFIPINPDKVTDNIFFPPQAGHPLGTDELGREIWVSIIYGARISLLVGFASGFAAIVVAVLLGSLSAYRGGWVDMLVMRVTEMFQVLPTFMLAALIVALSGPGLVQVILVIILLAWPKPARVMRGEVLRLKEMDYVARVRCLGMGGPRILAGEIVPNALAPVLALGPLVVGQAILVEASLGFLGLTSPELISWGKMLNQGQRFLLNGWWLSVSPGVAIFLTVLAFNVLGDAISAAFDPHRKKNIPA